MSDHDCNEKLLTLKEISQEVTSPPPVSASIHHHNIIQYKVNYPSASAK